MTALLLQWGVVEPTLDVVWVGPTGALEALARRPGAPLAGLVVPPAIAGVTEGEGIDLVGNEIRVNIEELPSA